MVDNVDKERRSEIMKAVKSKKNRSTELKLIQIFKELGIKGWRRNYPVKGHPDFVFLKKKIAVFTDGCFWHGHYCRTWPKSNVDFWERKLSANVLRDKTINTTFEKRGWAVIRIYECELAPKGRELLMNKIRYLS